MKCKYAGDVNDEDCAKCNGVETDFNGEMKPCKGNCPGYEDDKAVKEKPKKEVKKQEAPVETYEPKAKATTIKFESSISVQVKDMWYRVGYTEERALPAKCNKEKELTALCQYVNNVVDTQIEDIMQSSNVI